MQSVGTQALRITSGRSVCSIIICVISLKLHMQISPYFHAVEVLKGRLLFQKNRRTGNSRPPFRYIPLHDLESLWWVAVYLLLARRVVAVGGKPPVPLTHDSEDAQKEYFSEVFVIKDQRMNTLGSVDYFHDAATECLHSSLVGAVNSLDKMRTWIIETVVNSLASFAPRS